MCEKKFAEARSLKNHILGDHQGIKNFKCDFCGKCFADKMLLNSHHKKQHDEDYKKEIQNRQIFKCDLCDYTYSFNYMVQRHKNRVHKQSPWTCQICKKYFGTNSHLGMHMKKVHDNSSEFKCTICDKVFKSKVTLGKHLQRHSNCSKCKKSFMKSQKYASNVCKMCL